MKVTADLQVSSFATSFPIAIGAATKKDEINFPTVLNRSFARPV